MSPNDIADREPRRLRRSLLVLAGLGLLSALLSGFLWQQLLVARAGGIPVCGFGGAEDCGALWDSAFASTVHSSTGVPVAGWGLAWGLVALALPLLALADKAREMASAAILWVALGGLFSSGVLAGLSLTQGIFCAGCVGTYVLVMAYAAVAFAGLRTQALRAAGPGLALALSATLVAFLVVLYPGLRTPMSASDSLRQAIDEAGPPVSTPAAESGRPPSTPVPSEAAEPEDGTEGEGESERVAPGAESATATDAEGSPSQADEELRAEIDRTIRDFILQLDPQAKQVLADGLYVYKTSTVVPAREPRLVVGSEDAPVLLTDFTDIRCPACADLHANLTIFERVLPPGTFRLEPRHFPLDGRCNPLIPKERPEPIRCLAAKALICLESFAEPIEVVQVQGRLFEMQKQLDEGLLFSITDRYAPRAELQACMDREATQEKLEQDIRWAEQQDIRGTPLVLLNGRKASSFGAFLYVLLLNEGDPEHPAFDQLPPPSERVAG